MAEGQEKCEREQCLKILFKEVPTSQLGTPASLNLGFLHLCQAEPFRFKQDISHLPGVWASLRIGFVFVQIRSQGPRGLQPNPIFPFLPLKLIARKTLCSRGQLGAQEAILYSWFPSWVNLSRHRAISIYPLRPLGSLLFHCFPHTLPFVMASPGSLTSCLGPGNPAPLISLP